jgi:hypothetical protein
MKFAPLAAAVLCLGATTAFAQASAEPPKHNCDPKPVYPGLQAMKSEVEVKQFEGIMKNYKDCIVAYISARKSAQKAEVNAENAAAQEYNDVIGKFRADQEAAIKERDAAKAAAQKNEPMKPNAPAKY